MDNSKILVSFLMSVYNEQEHIRESLNSIINQTHSNFEAIIINDGSTDSSADIIGSIAENDPRIKLINNKNQGLGKSLNEGIELAKGKYIARLDADDFCTKDRLEKQIKFLEKNPEITAVGSWLEILYNNSTPSVIRKRPVTHKEILRNIVKICPLAHPSVTFNRETIKISGGYDINFDGSKTKRYGMDYELWVRLLSDGHKLANIPEALVSHRKHSGSISGKNNLFKKLRERLRIRFYAIKKIGFRPIYLYHLLAIIVITIIQHNASFKIDNFFNSTTQSRM